MLRFGRLKQTSGFTVTAMNKIAKAFKCFFTLSLIAAVILLLPHLKEAYDKASHPLKYSEYVARYSSEFGVPESLCYAVIKCESGFDSGAVSSAGAMGLMQMLPSTFFDLCSRLGESHDQSMLFSPEISIKYGIYYLSRLYRRFGVWETAVAAYNCGQGRVAGWIEDGLTDEYGNLADIPINETREYASRVYKAKNKYEKLYTLGEVKWKN